MGNKSGCVKEPAELLEPERLINASGKEMKQSISSEISKDPAMDEGILSILQTYNQNHLIEGFAKLNDSQKRELLQDLKQVNFIMQDFLFYHFLKEKLVFERTILERPVETCESFRRFHEDPRYNEIYYKGLEAIQRGETCLMLMVGEAKIWRPETGQDETLLNLTLPSGQSVSTLELLKDFIQKVKDRTIESYGGAPIEVKEYPVTICIMTSYGNHDLVSDFLILNRYFDYHPIFVFTQDDVVAINEKGKMLMKTKTKLLRKNMGSGSVFKMIKSYNITAELIKRGHKIIQFLDFNNLTPELLDPFVIGSMREEPRTISTRFSSNEVFQDSFNICLLMNEEEGTAEISNEREPKNAYLPIDTYVPIDYIIDDELFLSKYNMIKKWVNQRTNVYS